MVSLAWVYRGVSDAGHPSEDWNVVRYGHDYEYDDDQDLESTENVTFDAALAELGGSL